MSERYATAYPLYDGEGIYHQALIETLDFITDTTPSHAVLRNYLQRTFSAQNNEFTDRQLSFLRNLNLIAYNDTTDTYSLAPAGRRYHHTEAGDILYHQFNTYIEQHGQFLIHLTQTPATLAELTDVAPYDKTTTQKRLNWLETMNAITAGPNGEYTITQAGHDYLSLYTIASESTSDTPSPDPAQESQ